mmetsp:Transcript_15026/g.35420  ORF Transcript_15026/g.35420 Transcript_15026/m.35420 type:complete len:435 (-) Transcript_15026:3986-5290(-)
MEANGRRHAGEREHEQRHDQREPGAALAQAGEVLDLFGFMALARQQDDHAEGAQRRQHIGDGVEHRRAVGIGGRLGVAMDDARGHAQQHEAHVGNGRVGQHALEIGLCDGGEVADQQRHHRQHDQHLLPVHRQADHAFHQQAHRDRERGQLGRRADQQRDGRGRTLVDVRHPHVEGSGPELEGQAGHHEDDTEHQHIALRDALGDDVKHLRNGQRAGRAVHHRQAVEQEAAGQRTEHEVLHRRLGRNAVVAPQGYEGVQRQAHQLQAEVDDEEVVCRQHHVDAQQCEQAQDEELALQHLAHPGVRPGIHQRDQRGDTGEAGEQMAHRVGDHHVLHRIAGQASVEVAEMQAGNDDQGQLGQPVGGSALFVGDPQVDQGDDAAHHQKQDFRIDREPVHVVHCFASARHQPGMSLLCATCCSSSVTEACITSVKGLG